MGLSGLCASAAPPSQCKKRCSRQRGVGKVCDGDGGRVSVWRGGGKKGAEGEGADIRAFYYRMHRNSAKTAALNQ